MTREETIKLLALIKVAYPTAYKDMDNAFKQATVNMWHSTFQNVHYTIMEMAFNNFIKASKFPPTIAEMRKELESLYWDSLGSAVAAKAFKQNDKLKILYWIVDQTSSFRYDEFLDSPVFSSVGKLESGSDKLLISERSENNE